jgi:phytoene dehydrogenase-like protein
VTPQALYGSLLNSGDVAAKVRVDSRRYRYGRGAMQIHLALDRPVSWTDDRLDRVPLVHVGTGADSTGVACAQAEANALPAEPTVVVGQQHILDKSRVPVGKASLWVQLQEVPYRPTGDAAGQLNTADGWSDSLKRGYLDRILARIGRHATGLESSIIATNVISPPELEQANVNARFGDPYGGSAELDQNLMWRPLPSAANHRTSVAGLWHIGSSTHPGPGLGGGSGHLVAQRLARSRTRGQS